MDIQRQQRAWVAVELDKGAGGARDLYTPRAYLGDAGAAVVAIEEGGGGVEKELSSLSHAEDGQVEQAVAPVGVAVDGQAHGVAADVGDKHQGGLVADALAVGNYFEGGELIFPKGPDDRPDVVYVCDIACAKLLYAVDDFGVESDSGDGHESLAVSGPQVEVGDFAALQGLDGGQAVSVEAQLGGQEVFGSCGDDCYGHVRMGGGVGDGSDGAIATRDDNGVAAGIDGLVGEFAGVLEGLGEIDVNGVALLVQIVADPAYAVQGCAGAGLGVDDETVTLARGHIFM